MACLGAGDDAAVARAGGTGSRPASEGPRPILNYLRARGDTLEGEYIVHAGCPVQFLPPTSTLAEEVLAAAVSDSELHLQLSLSNSARFFRLVKP